MQHQTRKDLELRFLLLRCLIRKEAPVRWHIWKSVFDLESDFRWRSCDSFSYCEARRTENAEQYVDATTITTQEEMDEAVATYSGILAV